MPRPSAGPSICADRFGYEFCRRSMQNCDWQIRQTVSGEFSRRRRENPPTSWASGCKNTAGLSSSTVDLMQSGKSGFSIENVEVAFVEKQTASSFSTGLSQDADFDHAIHRGGRGWKAHLHLAC